MHKLLVFVILIFLTGFSNITFGSSAADALKYLPVQDGGRVKPYDTFARESLQLVYGQQVYQKRPALEVVTTWFLIPQFWETKPIVEINYKKLKAKLQLAQPDEKYFSPQELFASMALMTELKLLDEKRQAKEKLDPYWQAVQRLENQLGLFQMIKSGKAIRILPPKTGDTWLDISQFEGVPQQKFAAVIRSFIHALPNLKQDSGLSETALEPEASLISLDQAVNDYMTMARAENPSAYGEDLRLKLEVHNNEFHPFMWTWILYLLTAVLLAMAWQSDSSKMYTAGWVTAVFAFLLHSYGFGLRMYLTGRPPVSNMYESVVWVSWGTLLFAMIFEAMKKKKFVLMAGSVVGTICLVIANSAPAILDSSLQPLEPVLRSTLWLTIHVLVITISYSAFFLAAALGNIALWGIIRGESERGEKFREISLAMYRAVQIGVVLLAVGIIMGGVWADYSWGRFWGWDPKETWAFIAFMGYIGVLHGRISGMLRAFGFVAAVVISFALVIMAWYGVNYVLGAGLHSYGFGAGGVEYVAAVVGAQILFVAFVGYRLKHPRQMKTAQS